MATTKVTFDSDQLNYASELMRALAHPLRLKIIEFIHRHESTHVNKIYNTLQIEQSITSQHLKILRLVGVVSSTRRGKFVEYSLNYEKLAQASKAVNKFARAETAYYSKAS